ncbi:hypothetical protein CCACVL1_12515 [Corchorus capsularis]|uniref:Uncharacterized protein n=1 Tax=Corchorus capsularis TaxID=210143 RepID=A0A1R3IFA6_COCAP|nr:hypothetical protein CCACVL1_12515 [Corchorus capsularis]
MARKLKSSIHRETLAVTALGEYPHPILSPTSPSNIASGIAAG